MLKIFGTLDLAAASWFVFSAFRNDKIPFLSDIMGAIEVSNSWGGGIMPIIIASANSLLTLSLFISGISMLHGARVGKYIMYGQIPFRLFFVAPSFFFLFYISGLTGVLFLAALALSEVTKTLLVHRAYSQHNNALNTDTASVAG